ncbi:hypothetical protein V9L20_16000 [Variovorax sp. CCNWLW225]|uniref:hypothetical protein n=1 Tax=Variovorax sp. CCNWLW225 TaxID=3127462 RepID=UPI0030773600
MRTLKNAVQRELRNWQKTNPHSGKFSHPWYVGWALKAGRYPVLAAVLFLASFATIACVTCWLPPPYGGFVQFGPAEIDKFSVDTLFSGLWATQATLVALVYPVGFGFATIFLQKSHATKATLQTYLVTSGAKLTGTCGLALLMGLTVSAAVVSTVSQWTAFAWLILGATFLCLNIFLTGKFLLKTFAFATPEARRRERHTYAVMIAWPDEWCRHAASVIAASPVRFKLLHADELATDVNGKAPAFYAGPFAYQEVVEGAQFSFRGRRLVTDVRYWLVQLAYNHWVKRATDTPTEPNKTSFHREGPLFVLRAWPSPLEAEHGEFLAGTTKKPHLTWLEKQLLWWAVSFSSLNRYDSEVTVRDCLDEIRAELVQVINEGASDDFDRQFLSLLSLMDDLLEASFYKDQDGKPSNHALTASSTDLYSGTSVLSIWCTAISDMLKSALEVCDRNPYFAAKLSAVPRRLFSRERDVLSHELRILYLAKQHEFLHQVLVWGAEQLMGYRSNAGTVEDALPEPFAGRWKTVLTAALGAWESFKNESVLRHDDGWAPWGAQGRDALDLLAKHLERTVSTVAATSRGGSVYTAMYLTDTLLRWRTQLSIFLDRNDVYIASPWQLTLESTEKPWPDMYATHLQGYSFGDDTALMVEAWAAALENYWRDCCGAMAATLAQEYTTASAEVRRLITTVLQGVLFGDVNMAVPDGHASRMRPFADANEFVLSLIRQHVIDGGFREGYRQRLDNVVKLCAGDDWANFIPGRSISLSAPDSLEDVRFGQAVCLCLFVAQGWAPSVAELKAVFRSWTEQDARRGELDGVLAELAQSMGDGFEARYHDLWGTLLPTKSLSDSVKFAKGGIASIREALSQVRSDELKTAPISQGVLDEYADALTLKLDLERCGFPFRPKTVTLAEERTGVPESVLTFSGYPKGRLTVPQLASRSQDEPDHLLQYIVSRMRFNVVEALTDTPDVEVLAASKGQLLALISDFKRALAPGRSAVLLVPTLSEPKWLRQLRSSSSNSVADSPEDFLVKQAGYRIERNYAGHIRDVAVYQGMVSIGNLYLLSNHSMSHAELLSEPPGRIFRVTAEATAEDPTLCKLGVRWRLAAGKSPDPVWRIPYDATESPSEDASAKQT